MSKASVRTWAIGRAMGALLENAELCLLILRHEGRVRQWPVGETALDQQEALTVGRRRRSRPTGRPAGDSLGSRYFRSNTIL
jgi:hypothetical protein